MVKLAWLLIFVAIGISAEASKKNGDASIKDHPCVVSIRRNGMHVCSGVMLDKYRILTTIKCAPSLKRTWNVMNNIQVVTNAQTIWDIGERYVSKETRSQNHFKNPTNYPFWTGLAIHTVAIPIKNIQPVELYEKEIPVGASVQMCGWNIVRHGEDKYEGFREVTLQVIDRKECQEYHKEKNFTDDEFCTQRGTECEFCKGNSGDPLFYEGKLVGLATNGISCEESRVPDIHPNVKAIYKFCEESSKEEK